MSKRPFFRTLRPTILVVSVMMGVWLGGVLALALVPAAPQEGAPVTAAYLDQSNASFAYQDPSGRFTVHVRTSRPVYETQPPIRPL
ncbi:MAG: hypothetical protein V3U93_09250 [Alphaproteobacteria bacterium]